jgi:uncharacterized integral membrane protein (TIGR00697 family)
MHNENRERNIILLSGIFVTSLVTANLLGSKLIEIFGIKVSVGVFIIPVTFLVTDLLSELYGKEVAKRTVVTGIVIQLYALVLVWLGGLIPSLPERNLDPAYQAMFSLTPNMIMASIIAYCISQSLDVRIYHWIKNKTQNKHLWLRNNGSTLIAQLVDTSIFVTIFLFQELTFIERLETIIGIYFFKVTLAALDTPFVYLGVYFLDRKGKH